MARTLKMATAFIIGIIGSHVLIPNASLCANKKEAVDRLGTLGLRTQVQQTNCRKNAVIFPKYVFKYSMAAGYNTKYSDRSVYSAYVKKDNDFVGDVPLPTNKVVLDSTQSNIKRTKEYQTTYGKEKRNEYTIYYILPTKEGVKKSQIRHGNIKKMIRFDYRDNLKTSGYKEKCITSNYHLNSTFFATFYGRLLNDGDRHLIKNTLCLALPESIAGHKKYFFGIQKNKNDGYLAIGYKAEL